MNWAQFFNREQFYINFIADDRFVKYILGGLKTTLIITVFAILLGIVVGFFVGAVRSTYDRNDRPGKPGVLLSALNAVCRVYLSVIRGTPVVVQLMIMYYFIFATPDASKLVIAVLAFGINSGAYVSEIFRSGIMSIDNGQFEAGRSLGFNYVQTIWYIILPQAVKNILPALCNEFIALLKETSVSGYIALQDLTKGGDIIRSRTYNAALPLLTVAVVYWIVVTFLSYMVGRLEKRLRKNERKQGA